MHALDRLVSAPRILEIDDVEIAAPASIVWNAIRHRDLARSPVIRALFLLRSLPSRLKEQSVEEGGICVDDMVSTLEHPGFQVLSDDPLREVVVGAIGKVWHLDIPFVHVADEQAFAAFNTPGYVKVAWALRLNVLSSERTRLTIELRVTACDEASWAKFSRYFLVIGPASRFIRHTALKALAKELGKDPLAVEATLPGDDLLPDAATQLTQDIEIRAAPEDIWPWLVQMGCDRAGFYSLDRLDNRGAPSARSIHLEWQKLVVGQRVNCVPDESTAFEVLRIDPARVLVLGALFDGESKQQLAFTAARPTHYWHVTWAFILEPVSEYVTRLRVRARASFARSEQLHAAWIRPVHYVMETVQLYNLRARVEGKARRDGIYDGRDGVAAPRAAGARR